MAKKNIHENSELVEFKSSDGQGETADPVAKGDAHANRGADKSAGETAIPQFATKVEALNAAIQHMSGLPKEAIADIFKGMTAGHDSAKAKATRRLGGTASDDASDGETIAQMHISPTSAKHVASEDMDVIFDGQELSEEVREKARTIFEAALNANLVSEVARIQEEFDARLVESLEEKITALTENVDKYLSYAVEQWVADNEVAIETGLKAEVVEGFIHGLKTLFQENYVDIPDDKVDLVAELTQHVADLEDKVNSALKENVELKDYVDSLEVDKIFSEAVDSLPLTQAEKLRSLVEGIEYSDASEFTKKLNVIKESYFPSEKKSVSLTEEVDGVSDDEEGVEIKASGPMAHYVKAISQTTKK
jgi:hypothetical protein